MISPCADKGFITFCKSIADRDGFRRRFFVTAGVVVAERTMALDASASAIVV